MICSQLPPPQHLANSNKATRNSNLELYRIIVMLLIVAHHYVVNSGLISVLKESNGFISSSVMLLFGAWGKTGINCFVLITGYFMCVSNFSSKKLLKLYLQVAFYWLSIYIIFCLTGHDTYSPSQMIWRLWPVKSIEQNFVGCFIVFYLFIPVLNLLVNSMDRRLHLYLVALLLISFSVLPTFPMISMSHNYVAWFISIYMIASYIRIYGLFPNVGHRQWGCLALLSLLAGAVSVLVMSEAYQRGFTGLYAPYFFISDSNKILSVVIAVCSFMFFKDMKMQQSRIINIVGASTFGVLLIHANSDAMRRWLWQETVDCVGHFDDSVMWTLGYSCVSVLVIFIVCSAIEVFRAKLIEPKLFELIYDKSKFIFDRLQIAK